MPERREGPDLPCHCTGLRPAQRVEPCELREREQRREGRSCLCREEHAPHVARIAQHPARDQCERRGGHEGRKAGAAFGRTEERRARALRSPVETIADRQRRPTPRRHRAGRRARERRSERGGPARPLARAARSRPPPSMRASASRRPPEGRERREAPCRRARVAARGDRSADRRTIAFAPH